MDDLEIAITNIVTKRITEPPEYEMAIRNAFKVKRKKIKFQKIMKLVPVFCCVIIFTSGLVYAKDIKNWVTSLFINSTEAIDIAVENGYVQNVDMDFTYDKDIGIKVDKLVLDDLNLDISYIVETQIEDVKSVCLNDFSIINDNEKIIYKSELKEVETINELPIYNTAEINNNAIKLNNELFLNSLLFGLKPQLEKFKKMYFDVKSLNVTYVNDKTETIEGNWRFDVIISDEMLKNTNTIYTLAENNKYAKNCTGTLSSTGMIIKLDLISPVNFEEVMVNITPNICELFCIELNSQKYIPEYIEGGNGENQLIIHYNNISKYIENTDIIEIYLELYNSKIILKKID